MVGHFGIKKTQELIARKNNWPTLPHNVKAYVKGCDLCLASKTVRHKLYSNIQFLPVPTHYWKDLSMDFITGLSISTNLKRNSYNSILIIVDWLIKMVYYKLVKIIINASSLVKVIYNMVVWDHGFLNSIVTDKSLFFTWKFWWLLCYFFGIKQWLFIAFHLQTHG